MYDGDWSTLLAFGVPMLTTFFLLWLFFRWVWRKLGLVRPRTGRFGWMRADMAPAEKSLETLYREERQIQARAAGYSHNGHRNRGLYADSRARLAPR